MFVNKNIKRNIFLKFIVSIGAGCLCILLTACAPSTSVGSGDRGLEGESQDASHNEWVNLEDEEGAPKEADVEEKGILHMKITRSGNLVSYGTMTYEVEGEFDIDFYFPRSEAKQEIVIPAVKTGTAKMVIYNEANGISSKTTIIVIVEYDIRGVFKPNPSCSLEFSITEIWKEGASVVHEVGGIVLQGALDEAIDFTDNVFNLGKVKFPLSVGKFTQEHEMGNIYWIDEIEVSNINVPNSTDCIFDIASE